MSVFEDMQKLKTEGKLTPKELQLVNYILKNKYETKNLNMQQLADKSETSTGTILRLTKDKLGLEGFMEFKSIVITDLSSGTVKIYEKDHKTKIGIIINQSYENIKKTSEKQLNQIVQLISDARNILIFDREELSKFPLSKNLTKLGFRNQYITTLNDANASINHISNQYIKENKKYKEILSDTIYDNELIEKLMKKHNYDNVLVSVLTEEIRKNDNDLLDSALKNNFTSIVFISENTRGLIKNSTDHIIVDLNKDVGNKSLNNSHLSLSLYLKQLLIKIQELK